MRHRLILGLCVIAIAMISGPHPVEAVPGVTGKLSPVQHPSFRLEALPAEFSSISLPVGLLRHAVQAAEFVAYRRGETPEPTTDFGQLIIGLQFPSILPANLPTSPDLIRLEVSAGTVALLSEGGGIDPVAIIASIAEVPKRIALETASFTPVWSNRWRTIRVDLGYAIAGFPFEAVGNQSMIDLLQGGSLEPEVTYGLDLRSAFDLSVAAQTTAGLEFETPAGLIIPAVTIRLPLSLVHAETAAGIWMQTGRKSTSTSMGTHWQATYWYPGSGFGVGFLVDVGIALRARRGTIGFSLNRIVSAWHTSGISLGSDFDLPTSTSHNEIGFSPAPTVAILIHTRQTPGRVTAVAGFLQYRDRIVASLATTLRHGGISMVGGVGFDAGPSIGAGLGVVLRSVYLEPSLEIRTDPLTRTPVVGLSVQVARVLPVPETTP